MTDNLPLALDLCAAGYRVFPCGIDKVPRTKNGFHDASNDPAVIKAWGSHWKDGLIGIECSKRSGRLAVDLDNKNGKDGSADWARLVEARGGGVAVDVGPIQRTPSGLGGFHLVFRYPAIDAEIRNTAGVVAPGIDIRSAGYICTGPGYEWQPLHGYNHYLTDLPAWLVSLITEPARPAPIAPPTNGNGSMPTSKLGEIIYSKALERSNERNLTCHWMTQQLLWNGFSESEIEDYVLRFQRQVENAKPGEEPFTEKEALRTMQSALKSSKPGQPWSNDSGYCPQNVNKSLQDPEPPENFDESFLSSSSGIVPEPALCDQNDHIDVHTPESGENLSPIGDISEYGRHKSRWELFELYAADFPEPRWAVRATIPIGLSSLSGRPKLGKSWLVLQLAHAVGTGGRFLGMLVDKGKALVIALEDSLDG